MAHKYETIDEYIASFPVEIQQRMELIRNEIKRSAPLSQEVISYNMPAFKQKKVLVYFAAYEHHIGFYPTAQPIEYFQEKLKKYKTSKGAIQFSHDEEIPLELICEIVRYRLTMLG